MTVRRRDSQSFQATNGGDQRAGTVDFPFVKLCKPGSVACTPSMGVILWGASPLCFVPVISIRESSYQMDSS